MNCKSVQDSLSLHLDSCLPVSEEQRVSLHLRECRECALQSKQMSELRGALKKLPVLAPPERLQTQLRVMASRERMRRLVLRDPGSVLVYYFGRIQLLIENLMRPHALPFAGGLASAILIFSVWLPSLATPGSTGPDVPTAFYTQAAVKAVNLPYEVDEDMIVEVEVNELGQATDYTVTSGKWTGNREKFENSLLFTEFTPATIFGQPLASKLFLSFSRKQLTIKS